MNSNIDITRFSNSSGVVHSPPDKKLVAPPRRIFSRYLLPVLLLAGFGAIAAYSFRSAFVPVVDVYVTMPVPAPDHLLSAQAQQLSSIPTPDEAEQPGASPSIAASAPVQTNESAENPPSPGRGQTLFQAPGWIEPSPYPIMISALRSGTIQQLEIIEGQSVTSGTIVARLINEDQLLAVRAHESALRLKEARYKAARERWESPTDLIESVRTAHAKSGQLDAQARRQRDLIQLANLEAEIGTTLTRSGYEASLETTRKETELSVTRHDLLETQAEVALNSATLQAAEERLRLRIEDREAVETAAAELEAAKVALDEARLQLERSVIKAPTDGTIMRLTAAPGTMLSPDMEPGMTVAQMYKPDMLQVRVDVPLAEAAKVRPGLPAEIRVEALPNRRFRGELVNIVPEFDLQKNILPVKVRVYDPDEALRPEMIARVEFFAEQPVAPKPPPAFETSSPGDTDPQKTQAAQTTLSTPATQSHQDASSVLMIPTSALRVAGTSRRVMVVSPDNTTQEKILGQLADAGDMVLVGQGLRISDKIIISPKDLQSGRSVKIKGVIENGVD